MPVQTQPIINNYWKFNTNRLQVDTTTTNSGVLYPLYNNGTTYTYSTNKSYQFITHVLGYTGSGSFSVTTPWDDTLEYVDGMTSSNTSSTQSYFHYSTPTTTTSVQRRATFNADDLFSGSIGITDFKLNEINFNILGFSYFKRSGYELLPNTNNSLGWYYDNQSDKYYWYDYISGSPSSITEATESGYFPVGGSNNSKTSNVGYRLNNALYKFIPYSYFNFSFGYQNNGNSPLKIYLSSSVPNSSPANWDSATYTPPTGSILLATITQSVAPTGETSLTASISQEFYGVRGNKYLIFVGGFAGVSSSTATYSSIYLQNIKIEGGYHPGNNRQYVMDNYPTYTTTNISGATYTALVGTGNTVNATSSLYNPGISQIYAKMGNGTFRSGVWENGVWNSGWRVDENMFEFHNVYQYFNYNKGKRWRLQLTGPTSSVSEFNIGDNVAISNIAAIDINEDRKLIKGYYTIINKTNNSIIVEFDNNFPIRRIEKDSDNHRIYVTKNVWLSGGFLNGYFTGIWNYGLFKGYPLITEMYDSHWIDGIFDGGHFHSELVPVPDFVDTVFQSGKVGLTFSSKHGLIVGDKITIDKDDKTINPQYDGEHTVTSVVDDYLVVTEIDWGQDSTNESGKISTTITSGLLQRVDFKSNNISKITSKQSDSSAAVFVYNSWMDIVYNITSASNIGKPQSMLNILSRKSYSENNLYGYITDDVLESTSTFRDSFSNTIRKYRLGTKYKIFGDFIGDAGNFQDDFGGSGSDAESSFLKYGWTYSETSPSSLTFSRTIDNNQDDGILGQELRVQTIGDGGILDFTPTSEVDVNNKLYQEVEKLRYTKVEFDLITHSNPSITYTKKQPNVPVILSLLTSLGRYKVPGIHFDNLNLTYKNIRIGAYGTYSLLVPSSYLPIYNNVNHLSTPNKKKVEYFYNKRNLSMSFSGYRPSLFYITPTQTVDYVIDNLHFYEVDMIPFFQYFTTDNINKGIAIPYQGLSPFIDYTNSNFSFIDNISIGLDSIQTQSSNTVISGVGTGVVGVGGGVSTQDDNGQSSLVFFDSGTTGTSTQNGLRSLGG